MHPRRRMAGVAGGGPWARAAAFDRNARPLSKLTRFCLLYLFPQHSALAKRDRAGKTTVATRSIQTSTQALRTQDKEPRTGEEPREVDSCRL